MKNIFKVLAIVIIIGLFCSAGNVQLDGDQGEELIMTLPYVYVASGLSYGAGKFTLTNKRLVLKGNHGHLLIPINIEILISDIDHQRTAKTLWIKDDQILVTLKNDKQYRFTFFFNSGEDRDVIVKTLNALVDQ